jgi:post-segregation antitoxin (ccd killing protein)
MKLLNVRLDAEDARKAEMLRKQGVEISSVVRAAIRAEYERRRTKRRDGRSAAKIMAEIYARHPDPADLPARDYDVHDAKQARAAIVAKLKRERK